MITQYIRFLYENNITFAELAILLYLNKQISKTDFYNYVKLFETREKNYVYDRININIVFDLLEEKLIVSLEKEDTFVNKLAITLDTLLTSYKPTKKGLLLVNKFTDIFNNTSKINNLIQTDSTNSFLDDICRYWYDDRYVPFKTTAISDKSALEAAFKKFREDNSDFSNDLIRKAVLIYFEQYRKSNCKSEDGVVSYNFLTSQLDFIAGSKTYSLKTFCETNKNSNVLIANKIISLD